MNLFANSMIESNGPILTQLIFMLFRNKNLYLNFLIFHYRGRRLYKIFSKSTMAENKRDRVFLVTSDIWDLDKSRYRLYSIKVQDLV